MKLTDSQKIFLIYRELYAHDRTIFSSRQLLALANEIFISLTSEPEESLVDDGVIKSTYFSHEVDQMLKKRPFWVASNELRAVMDMDGSDTYNLKNFWPKRR